MYIVELKNKIHYIDQLKKKFFWIFLRSQIALIIKIIPYTIVKTDPLKFLSL